MRRTGLLVEASGRARDHPSQGLTLGLGAKTHAARTPACDPLPGPRPQLPAPGGVFRPSLIRKKEGNGCESEMASVAAGKSQRVKPIPASESKKSQRVIPSKAGAGRACRVSQHLPPSPVQGHTLECRKERSSRPSAGGGCSADPAVPLHCGGRGRGAPCGGQLHPAEPGLPRAVCRTGSSGRRAAGASRDTEAAEGSVHMGSQGACGLTKNQILNGA